MYIIDIIKSIQMKTKVLEVKFYLKYIHHYDIIIMKFKLCNFYFNQNKISNLN